MPKNRENLTKAKTLIFKHKHSESSKAIFTEKVHNSYAASPRPGGYLKFNIPPISKEILSPLMSPFSFNSQGDPNELFGRSKFISESKTKTNSSLTSTLVSADVIYHPKKIKKRKNKVKEFSSGSTEKSESDSDSSEIFSDNMLAVTISCVMLMAANSCTVPDIYLSWGEHYLSCIKDIHGNHPPNIDGILSHIRNLQKYKLSAANSSRFSSCSAISNKTKINTCPNNSNITISASRKFNKKKPNSRGISRTSKASNKNSKNRIFNIKRSASCSVMKYCK